MALVDRPKKELSRNGHTKLKSLVLSGTSLASVESLSMPIIQEVVLSADIRCTECQKRVADVMARMDETESMEVNLLEKKVTLTGRYANVGKPASQKLLAIRKNPLGKVAMIKQIFGSSRRPKTDQVMVSNPVSSIFMPAKYYCMLLRINIDCNACCRKLRRIILNMKEIETHLIEKKECSVCVCGVFRPSDVAIKIRKKMNRRVEILEIQDCDGAGEQTVDQNPGPAG